MPQMMHVPPLLVTPPAGASVVTDARCVSDPLLLMRKLVIVGLENEIQASRLSGALIVHALGAGEILIGAGIERLRRVEAAKPFPELMSTCERPVAVGTKA